MSNTHPLPRQHLAALCAGGFLASLWALFQWGELLVARAGGTPFCAIGGGFDCAAVWDSALAKAVHDVTQVPIAGFGLMWGIAAFAVPLLSLARPDVRGAAAALRLSALVGVASIVALAAASLAAGAICIGCLGTYVLVAAWAVLAFLTTKPAGFADLKRGALLAGGVTLAAYLLLLVPGMRTARALATVSKDAIAAAGAAAKTADKALPDMQRSDSTPGPFAGPSTGDAGKDAALEGLLAQLPADAKQMMSDLLGAYETAPVSPSIPAARTVRGTAGAPVRIVDWTDPLCPHCAELHEVLDEISKVAPGSIAVESHFFPLDGLCNPSVERKSEAGEIRCVASKALMCLESDAEKFHLGHKLVFENQRDLTIDKLWQVLAPITDRKVLETCMASPELQKRLDDDIAGGIANHLEGTPLVLLNGKEVQPFGPILYALSLTGGKTKTAAFRSLPPPRPLPAHNHAH